MAMVFGTKKSLKTALMTGAALIGTMVAIQPAFAQSTAPAAAPESEKVTVTGSRIKKTTFTADRPVSVITGETVRQSSVTDLGELLRRDVAVGARGFGSTSNLSGSGSSNIALRTLNGGTTSTLVLLNGKRVATFADSLGNEVSDISTIPLAMVGRVELLRDGASATYGTDAIAGVVNIIMRDNYEGLELSASQGMSTYGDAESTIVSGVFGANMDRGNVTLGMEYRFQDDVPQRDREWAIPTVTGLGATITSTGSGAYPGGRVFSTAGVEQWCTRSTRLGGDEQTNGSGTPIVCDHEGTPGFKQVNRYDYALVQSLLGQRQVLSFVGSAHYDINDDITAFGEFLFAQRASYNYLDAGPLFFPQAFPYRHPADPLGGRGWFIPATNPYLIAAGVGQGGMGVVPGAYLQTRPSTTVGPRTTQTDVNTYRANFGFRGEDLGGFGFDWEVGYLASQSQSTDVVKFNLNLRNAITISDPALCAADVFCAAALLAAGKGTATVSTADDALDVLRPANWRQAEIAYMRQLARGQADYNSRIVYGDVTGELFNLFGAGEIGLAAGFEYRTQQGEFLPDGVTANGDSVANRVQPGFVEIWAAEMYGELDIPILADVPFFHELTVNLQGRIFEYSNFGKDTVYKTGLVWAPWEDLKIRANMGTSFRAPTPQDLVSATVSFDTINDPCNNLNAGSAANLIANCAAAGIGLGINNTQIQHSVQTGGDLLDGVANLTPETGESFTVGMAFNPDWFKGFQLSVDYYLVTLTAAITRENTSNIVSTCYNGAVGLVDPNCARFQRFTVPAGPGAVQSNFVGLTSARINGTGRFEEAGIDWAVRYATDMEFLGLPDWDLTLDHVGNYTLDQNVAQAAADKFPGVRDSLGLIVVGSGSTINLPYLRGTGSLRVGQDGWWMQWGVRYWGAVDDQRPQGRLPNALSYDGVDAQIEHDISFLYDVTENFALNGSVTNVFDEEAPYAFSTGTNTDQFVYGTQITGRYFNLRGTFRM